MIPFKRPEKTDRVEDKMYCLSLLTFIIADLQSKIMKAQIGKADKKKMEPNIKLVDDLLLILSQYDKFVFDAQFERHRAQGFLNELTELQSKVADLKEDNEKLLKTIQWKP